ncbi:acyl-CoA dehydrogenase family protein (plasmid) [Methylobacterium radiotolerans]|jgi:alkylation response protein AidB-like acyl-CoA dehydrogenase
MQLALSSSQLALQDSVRRFCRDHYSGVPRPRRADEHWNKFAELGWLGSALPVDVGGSAATPIETAILLEEFGRALVVEPFWSCVVLAGRLIDLGADRPHRAALLPPLVAGGLLIAAAHSEDAHSGMDEVTTLAVETADAYTITGTKTLIIDGPNADKFIIPARTSDGNIGLFLMDQEHLSSFISDYGLIDGRRACDLAFRNVQISRDALIGPPAQGRGALDAAIDEAMVGLCAEAVGILDSVLWMTRDHLKLRQQYGGPLSTQQALQHRMADMFVEVEMSRSAMLRALRSLMAGDPTARRQAALAAYIHVCRSGSFVCGNGIQLHGAVGMTEESIIGQYFKRFFVISKMFGDVSLQLNRFSVLSSVNDVG